MSVEPHWRETMTSDNFDVYFETQTRRPEIMSKLRNILLSNNLMEEKKWNAPCYTSDGKNIAILHDFKEHSRLGFFKGVLINDPEKFLHAPGENSRQSRYLKFSEPDEVDQQIDTVNDFIQQAIEIERSGKQISKSNSNELPYPNALIQVFESDFIFEEAFENLTKGRQRGYLIHFNSTKNDDTTHRRIVKNRSRILDGKGLHDCVCGYSKRMPRCDGSHKIVEN